MVEQDEVHGDVGGHVMMMIILPMVRLYHCLALPFKENINNYHLKVLSDMPAIHKHAQVYANSHRCEYEFLLPSPEKD